MPYKDPEKQREYQRQWCAARRAEWFEGRSCIDCGSTDSLELDHVDRTAKVTHAVWSWSLERREAELAKCVVRCRPCHLAKGQREGDLGNRKLTPEQAQAILESSESGPVLAARYGVTPKQVQRVRRREAWGHLPY